MTYEGWRPLFADAAGFLGLSPEPVIVAGVPGGLPSRLPAGDAAIACVATALTAAAVLQRHRGGLRPQVQLDAAHVATAIRSEAHLRVNGHGFGSGFAPLSRFWRASDGWVRTHGNYPWHRDALLHALGCGGDREAVGAAIAGLGARGVAAAVRTEADWQAGPAGQAVAAARLVEGGGLGDAPPRRRVAGTLPA